MDIDRGQVETVLDSAEGVECNMNWKASLARYAWSILYAALYYASELVSAGHLYGIVAIWFWISILRLYWNFTTSIQGSM